MTNPGVWMLWPQRLTARDPGSRIVRAFDDHIPESGIILAAAPNNDLRPRVPLAEADVKTTIGQGQAISRDRRRPDHRPDYLLSLCWCGATRVWVSSAEVRAGRTRPCRNLRCGPTNQLTRVRSNSSW